MGKAKPKYCEICGAPIRGPGHRIRIERAEVLVCDKCYEKYGGKKPGTFSIMPTGRQPRRTAKPASRPKPQPRPYQPKPLVTEEIVEDFAERVYRAIQRSGKSYEELSHEIGLSVNDLRAIAHGYREPTIKEARKLERYFKIKLIESAGEESFEEKKTIPRDYEPTLGDIANIRIKKRKKK
ncbi:predicted transcription regulator, containing DNA-binding HTH domain [Thermococcus kodakarensis KOD1]|uniref:Predicted transcription regulator, containing DNA-binding HTH domain n=1 Tax=Thermococcus kodakarensis (strain ATCC BAA-918 / JCM 12380 / KOD1) TaxID=69014 RepID=Q5JFF8_THEKO|nr:multiprotein bridging factor aMBF1 [Thermococcus kodakarensis]WCN28234.1 multiprotein bridging factor aMBF1 [Thermococcus kodakarensis]WCN30530.1 multiprotein bridging factor aMBF1 [Thermococcus kodakarensis]BAD84315.1 predicted transcription regulator, containing DNA-binding HTH domain [Thermococcus kodakarensis KOD1]